MPRQATMFQRLQHIIGDSFGAAIVEQTIEKAIKDSQEKAANPKSVFYDPLTMFMGREWLGKTTAQQLSPRDLRMMANSPIISAIINTRMNQVAAFCLPRSDDYALGYEITPVDKKGFDIQMQDNLRGWVGSMGIKGYGESLLETFARKFMRDSLVLDQACAEIVKSRNGQPAYVVCVDAASIKRTKASLSYAAPTNKDDPWYVMVMDDRIVAEYASDEMIFGVRNPQTDMAFSGYGMSELETLVRTITTLTNTEKYNAGQLNQGGTAKGVLVVQGDVDQTQFDVFKREFREAIRNASQYWRPPVLKVGKDSKVDWQTLDRSNRDMEYAQLLDFLVKLACGVYQIDPQEINWAIGHAGAAVTFEGGASATKTKNSRDRGLRPLMTFLANTVNTNVISKLDDRFRLEFLGFDGDRALDAEIISKEVETFKTVNEAREERKLKNLGPSGDIILSQFYSPPTQGIEGEPPANDNSGKVVNPTKDTGPTKDAGLTKNTKANPSNQGIETPQ